MGRRKRVTPADISQRLAAVRLMIAEMPDALPNHARELRRAAAETIDDAIEDLRGL